MDIEIEEVLLNSYQSNRFARIMNESCINMLKRNKPLLYNYLISKINQAARIINTTKKLFETYVDGNQVEQTITKVVSEKNKVPCEFEIRSVFTLNQKRHKYYFTDLFITQIV